MGKVFSVEVRTTCKECGKPVPKNTRFRTYCSEKCRDRFHNKKAYIKYGGAALQREYWQKKRANDGKPKIQCLLCGKWFRQVGSHMWQIHKMSAREYREMAGFDVKRGQLPDDLRQLKAEQVFENKTVNNLKVGKKFWFKKGQEGVGKYKRSAQTMERLHKGTMNL